MVGNILGEAMMEAPSTRRSNIAVVDLESWAVGCGPGSYGPVGRISPDKVRDTSELQ